MSEPRCAGFWPRGGFVPAMASALGAAHGAELSRTEGGHRCYTSGDVRRLHRIVALRSLGISLEERGREYRTMAGFPEDSRGHTPIPGGLHG